MTKNAEILKAIHETLLEVRIPLITLPGGLELEFKIENPDHAKTIATEILARILPFIS